MGIIAARIDDRLLHGIVATQWVPEYKPQRLMVVDDTTANDPVKKASMRMAKPAGVALSIINRETAQRNFAAGKYDDHTVFLVARDPWIVADLVRAGQTVPLLTIGGTVPPEEGASATQVGRRAWVLDSENDAYGALLDSGTDVQIRFAPAEKPVELVDVLDLSARKGA